MERREHNKNSNFDQMNGDPYFLEPGFIYFSKESSVVQAVLGSCVAVCLWDRTNGYGAMNHFEFPFTKDQDKATPRYGNVSTIALIKMMKEAGANKDDLIAQIYGGGFPEKAKGRDIGAENVEIARSVLEKREINIASTDVGGCLGRKILFDTSTGQVAVLKVHKIRQSDWHESCFDS